jgi:hypothetical protein
MPHRIGDDVNFARMSAEAVELSTIMLSQGMEIYPRVHPSPKEIKSIFIDDYK